MFIARSFNVTPKTREQHLTARSDKTVAYVTNNKRLCSTFCTVKANYTDRHEVTRGLFATAELLVTSPGDNRSGFAFRSRAFAIMLWCLLFATPVKSVTVIVTKILHRRATPVGS